MTPRSGLSKGTFTKTALLQAFVLIIILFSLGMTLREFVRNRYITQVSKRLENLAEVLSRQVPQTPTADWCKEAGKNLELWISLISSTDGHMLCDSVYQPGTYPGVIDRPEVQSAIQSPTHRGGSIRLSPNDSNIQGAYAALFFPDRKLVLRVGLPLTPFEEDLKKLDRTFLVTILLLAVILTVVLQWTTRGLLFGRAKRALSLREQEIQEDFVANVSHEFRTPLTSILGFADASLRKLSQGEKPDKEFVEIIHKDANRLLTMVNDLLDLSALDSPSFTLAKEDIRTQEITEEVLKRLDVIYGVKKHKVRTRFDAETVYADPDRLLQVLLNLIGNAMKFSPAHSEIAIEWKQGKDELSSWTEFNLSDNGPGISPSLKQNLFKRFSSHSPTDAKTAGAGLGLAIVKGIMNAHEGEVSLLETPQGTHFRLKFRSPSPN